MKCMRLFNRISSRSLKESHEGAVDSFDRVRDENVRLAKTVDKLRTDNNELSIEKARLSAETRSLARKVSYGLMAGCTHTKKCTVGKLRHRKMHFAE